MAFPVAAEAGFSAAASSYSQPIPAGHRSGDLLLAFVYQDGGGTAFAGLATGWADAPSPAPAQAGQNAQRTHVFAKYATSSDEADFTVTGATDEWECVIVVVRNAHATTWLAAAQRTSVTGASPASGTLESCPANSLVLYALGYDGPGRTLVPQSANDQNFLGKTKSSSAGCLLVGYRNQISAGTAPSVSYYADATDGGSAWVIAIADDGDGQMAPESREAYEVLRYYGDYHGTEGTTWANLSTGAWSAATIDGLPVTATAAANVVGSSLAFVWNNFSSSASPGSTNNFGADAWDGACHTLPNVNMAGKVFGIRAGMNNHASPFGASGYIVLFEDNAGAWEAHRLTIKKGLPDVNFASYWFMVDVENWTPLASGGGTMNWGNVVRIGYAYHRVAGSTASRGVCICDAVLIGKTALTGGSAAAPVSSSLLETVLPGWLNQPMSSQQGSGQALIRASIQIGDGSTKTYANLAAGSIEFPRSFNASLARRVWLVPEDTREVRIKASATDVIRTVASVMATDTSQAFVIDSASSASATYDFAGLVLVGWKVTNNVTGVTFNGVTFSGCRGITLNGGGMDECVVADSLVSPAVTTDESDKITNCEFISSGSGHAIEITQPGPYTFAGNTFEGYGVDGTTDAAIYNNSGGAVTLNITGGGDTPTVRNGTGASTTVNNNVQITLEGVVVGSAIRVEKVSDGSLVEFRVADATTEAFSVAGGVNYRVKVRKASSAPRYKSYETQTGALSGDATIFISQILDE